MRRCRSGSWCPPCKHELPSIVELHDTLSTEGRIAFVLLQARESLEVSERWLARRKIELPLSDSGHESRSSNHFRLADGREVSDRAFARVFPTTYVLDSDGRVVFYKFGPIDDWMDYVDLFRNIK